MKFGIAALQGFIGACALNAANIAIAQDAPEDGFYVRAGAGVSFLSDLDQEFTYNPNILSIVTPPTGAVIDTEAGFVASGAVGFNYADGIRTELEYRYATNGIDVITPIGGFNPDAGPFPPSASDEDINAHFVFSNFYYDFNNSSFLTPFIGAGVGGAFVNAPDIGSDAALAYQGRAGVSAGLNDGFSVDLEYIYLRTNTLRFGPDPEDFTPDGPFGPAIDGDNYQSSSVMVSLRKQF
ncbi:MAG: outer membrane beta-barrel protein [Pseudomonadota bacterium]